ncbi:MAG: hypothetical protein HRT74_13400 [Flavobacteriales bacterium]|nr:hypothetical protein [Flavobacteriales bacterium]
METLPTIDLKKLQEPFPVKWRVQSSKGGNSLCVAYVDSRDVQKKLDEVCGIENWQSRHKEEKGNLFCEIGVFVNDRWIWKSDVGTESNIEKQKGEASDSFKRAAVMWGLGRFVYDYPIIKIKNTNYKGKQYPCSNLASKKALFDGRSLTAYINYCIENFDNSTIKKGI